MLGHVDCLGDMIAEARGEPLGTTGHGPEKAV